MRKFRYTEKAVYICCMEDESEKLVKIKTYEDLINAIKEKATESEVTNYRIAKDSDLKQSTVQDMMKGPHEAKFSNVMKAFEALGIEVYIKTKS